MCVDYYSHVDKDKSNGKVENISLEVHELNACGIKKKIGNHSSLLEVCLGFS